MGLALSFETSSLLIPGFAATKGFPFRVFGGIEPVDPDFMPGFAGGRFPDTGFLTKDEGPEGLEGPDPGFATGLAPAGGFPE